MKIETSQTVDVNENVTGNEMETTRNYESWRDEKSKKVPLSSQASKDGEVKIKKISGIPPGEDLTVVQSQDQESSINVTDHATTPEAGTSVALASTSLSSQKKASEFPTQNATGHAVVSKSSMSLKKAAPRVSSLRITTEKNLSPFDALIQDNQFSATNPRAGNMEMTRNLEVTRNYGAWEIEQVSVVISENAE